MADVCKGSQMCFCQHTMLIMVKLVLPGVFKEIPSYQGTKEWSYHKYDLPRRNS